MLINIQIYYLTLSYIILVIRSIVILILSYLQILYLIPFICLKMCPGLLYWGTMKNQKQSRNNKKIFPRSKIFLNFHTVFSFSHHRDWLKKVFIHCSSLPNYAFTLNIGNIVFVSSTIRKQLFQRASVTSY